MLGTLQAISSDLAHLGMWQPTGRPEWTVVFPAGLEPDPAIVKAIRVVAPRFVPLWVTREYISPTGERRTYGYYALGMHSDVPEESAEEDFEGLGPVNVQGWNKGGRLCCIDVLSSQWKDGSWQQDCNVPEPAEPFDERVRDWFVRTHYRLQKAKRIGDEVVRTAKAKKEAELQALAVKRDAVRNQNRADRFQLLRSLGKATSSTAVAPSPKRWRLKS